MILCGKESSFLYKDRQMGPCAETEQKCPGTPFCVSDLEACPIAHMWFETEDVALEDYADVTVVDNTNFKGL